MRNKGKARRQQRSEQRDQLEPRVVIQVPDTFLDVLGEPWTLRKIDGRIEELDLVSVLIYTVRGTPVKVVEDSERAYDIIRILQQSNEHIEMTKSDYDWLMGVMKDHAHTLWPPADAALLRRYLRDSAERDRSGRAVEKDREVEDAAEKR